MIFFDDLSDDLSPATLSVPLSLFSSRQIIISETLGDPKGPKS